MGACVSGVSGFFGGAPNESDALAASLGWRLLPPLWKVVSGYFSSHERWQRGRVPFFGIDSVKGCFLAGCDECARMEVSGRNYSGNAYTNAELLDLVFHNYVAGAALSTELDWGRAHRALSNIIYDGHDGMLEFLRLHHPNVLDIYYRWGFRNCAVPSPAAASCVLGWGRRHGYEPSSRGSSLPLRMADADGLAGIAKSRVGDGLQPPGMVKFTHHGDLQLAGWVINEVKKSSRATILNSQCCCVILSMAGGSSLTVVCADCSGPWFRATLKNRMR